ncbi:hypothetical protein EYF80_055660 [Liparis tanakae]|uniref:Uncharacterized protein n=1 Tax=Liparis tanakae TaxID=230148 RepID=A0A4Z2EYY1_9TELE|nr:hypothetical protein EYF80_055660 [Liparis tanakae]
MYRRCLHRDGPAYRWLVRSPVSSLAPATVCPTVTLKGFPETPTAWKRDHIMSSEGRFRKRPKQLPSTCSSARITGLPVPPPADSLWETMVTLIFALLGALLGVGLGACLLLPWDLSSSRSRPSTWSLETQVEFGHAVPTLNTGGHRKLRERSLISPEAWPWPSARVRTPDKKSAISSCRSLLSELLHALDATLQSVLTDHKQHWGLHVQQRVVHILQTRITFSTTTGLKLKFTLANACRTFLAHLSTAILRKIGSLDA